MGVTVKGHSLRSVEISPTSGTQSNDAFVMQGDSTVEDLTVKDFFYNKTWEELNKPFQKHHVVNAFPEFKKFKFKKHINLQLGSGIDKLFESLLNNNTLNPKGKYKSVSGLCQSWGKKV